MKIHLEGGEQTVDPTTTVLAAANGDFFLILFGIMFLFCMGLAGFFVYQMPKQWEAATNRIIDKITELVCETQEVKKTAADLSKKYDDHDNQAKIILDHTKEIKDEIRERRRMGLW